LTTFVALPLVTDVFVTVTDTSHVFKAGTGPDIWPIIGSKAC